MREHHFFKHSLYSINSHIAILITLISPVFCREASKSLASSVLQEDKSWALIITKSVEISCSPTVLRSSVEKGEGKVSLLGHGWLKKVVLLADGYLRVIKALLSEEFWDCRIARVSALIDCARPRIVRVNALKFGSVALAESQIFKVSTGRQFGRLEAHGCRIVIKLKEGEGVRQAESGLQRDKYGSHI